jgi:two-component system cell cycle sensor histidine kinase/response regulator CckA
MLQKIHLLLSDVVMPRMRGPELARRLSGIHAEAKAMYMSGHADLAIEGTSLQKAMVVTKPVDLTALARKIRQALQG